ncbi:MAG: nucleotidyl transferase AbiEii/AbiGii toxin family protein [Actinobacteria bacterium]|nr:nucleotidyl transferase AbiEii/AbiGii toxin family protein [Actinomycetota bacterium]
MTPLSSALRSIGDSLLRESAAFALVGGLAVSARTEPRFTRDIDLAVAASTDAAAEDLTRQLVRHGWKIDAITEQEAVDRLATVRLEPPSALGTAAVVDLLFASSGIESELVRDAESLEVLPGVVVPVATVAGLLVLKALATSPARPQDEVDLTALVAAASADDREQARRLAALVIERGFHRERDLVAEVDRRFT